MAIMMVNQDLNLVDDSRNCIQPYFIFALNVEGDHEGGFASRVIQEMEAEKFSKTGPLKFGQVVAAQVGGIMWYGIACYSLGSIGWDAAKPALMEGCQKIWADNGWPRLPGNDWDDIPVCSVQLPGGDKVGRMQGADPSESMAAFAEFDGRFAIYNG